MMTSSGSVPQVLAQRICTVQEFIRTDLTQCESHWTSPHQTKRRNTTNEEKFSRSLFPPDSRPFVPSSPIGAKMVSTANHIMLFTKHPTPRFAKTRLIPAVGAEAAADISRRLTEAAIDTTRTYTKTHPSTKTIIHYYAPTDLPPTSMEDWLQPTANETLQPQSSGDLGEKLISAFKASFSFGAAKVIVIGSDCPFITSQILEKAFKALDHADVVIGPAVDGGYYLLGMKALHENLFKSIPWSTSVVYDRTCEAVEEEGLKRTSLQMLRDIDTEEDLPYLRELLSNNSRPVGHIFFSSDPNTPSHNF